MSNGPAASGATSTPTLWAAIYAQAEAWIQARVVREVAAELPRYRPLEQRATGANTIASLLLELRSAYHGMLHPFMLGTRLPMILNQSDHHVDSEVEPDRMTAWLDSAATLEQAHRITLAWFRSRLPGYPVLPAPQLARNTPYTTNEHTPRFIWTPGERGSGLHFEPSPPRVPDLLGASGDLARSIEQAARDIHRELTFTAPWVAFKEAHQALDADARTALSSARRELARRLAPDAIDHHEPNLLLDRALYRTHHTAEVIAQLTGTARGYADAFTAIEQLLDLATTDVFSDLAVFGDPFPIKVSSLEFSSRGGEPFVEFDAFGHLPMMLDEEQVVWLEDTPVTDAVVLRGYQLNFSQTEVKARFTARILEGTSQAWPRVH